MHESWMLPCLNKMIFGIDCPGCGMQRALALLFQGDFQAAFELYPPVYTALPLVLSALFLLNRRFKIGPKVVLITGIIHSITVLIAYAVKMLI